MYFTKIVLLNLVCAVLSIPEAYKVAISHSDIFFYDTNPNGDPAGVNMRDMQNFTPKGEVKIVIHGFTGSKNHPSVTTIRNAFLTEGVNSVFVVNWSEASIINYWECRFLVWPIGVHLAKILETFLKTNNISADIVHIIGHSLGAHIAGNVGRQFNGTIGRITGLDPAKPYFTEESTDDLRSNQARFVDVIHSGAGALGDNKPRGDIDFYPNNGYLPQPGCATVDTLTLTLCSHFRATAYYAESILLPNSFPAVPCSLNNVMQRNGTNCLRSLSRNTAVMGEHVSRDARGIYFLETNNVPIYGMGAFSRSIQQN